MLMSLYSLCIHVPNITNVRMLLLLIKIPYYFLHELH